MEAAHAVDTWLHKPYSTTTNAIFMKPKEAKLDEQCYILPQKSFPNIFHS